MIKSKNEPQRPRYAQCCLPPELLARINSIYGHCDQLHKQENCLSLIYPHADAEPHRWHAHLQQLPYFHIITTEDYGNSIYLHVLLPDMGQILSLKKKNGLWEYYCLTDESEVAAIVPNRFSMAHSSWLKKPATMSQMARVAKLLLLPKTELPRLTAFNACLIIQTSLLMQDIETVSPIVEHHRILIKRPLRKSA